MSPRPLSSDWPQNRPRASTMAMAMPNGRLTSVATTATLRLSRTAVHSSGLRVIQSMLGSPQRIVDGISSGPPLAEHGESLRLEQRPGLVRFDVGGGFGG